MRLAIVRNTYRTALLLTAAICLIELWLLLYVTVVQHRDSSPTIVRITMAFAILIGIWLQSTLARYIGGLWFLISFLSFGWPLVIYFGGLPISYACLLVLGCLLFLACFWILLFSKQFAEEFALLRKVQPAYKTILRRLIVGALAISVVAATAVDVSRLFG